jgi:ubiquinone/menaquinone biosynthesis C-methylase UbiE
VPQYHTQCRLQIGYKVLGNRVFWVFTLIWNGIRLILLTCIKKEKGKLTMKMTYAWNRFIYRLWAPFYDTALGRFFQPGRKTAITAADLHPGDRVLFVGVGTGSDLPLLPQEISVTGIDLSGEMLAKANQKLPLPGIEVRLIQGDAQTLLVEDGVFDVVFFNLILSVIPDGRICLEQNLRALRPGGRVIVFDKFLPENGKLSNSRKLLNFFSTLFGTDITRRFSDLVKDAGVSIEEDEPSLLNGMYRVIRLTKS